MAIELRDRPLPAPLVRIRAAAARLALRHGHRLVVVFGSTARRAVEPRDLDIAVLGRGPLDLVTLTADWIIELRFQAIDLSDLTTADPVLQALVARDGIPVYEVEPGEFDRFCSLAIRRFADTRKFRDAEHDRIRRFIAKRSAQ